MNIEAPEGHPELEVHHPVVRNLTPDVTSIVAINVRNMRIRRELDAAQLSQLSGLDTDVIEKIERGTAQLLCDRLQRLASAFNCKTADLLLPN